MFRPKFKIQRIHKDARIPKFAHKTDAGMDLYAIENVELKSGEFKLLKTGFKMDIPVGYEVQIRSRSGLAAKKGVTVLNSPGTIDADYRGEFGVVLINHSKETFKIKKGDRIAQMVISKLDKFKIIEVDSISETVRAEGGFGSTGINDNNKKTN